jgi:hypothetical protein
LNRRKNQERLRRPIELHSCASRCGVNRGNARRRIGGRGFGKVVQVAPLFGNSLRSFRTFLADGLGVAAAAARGLNFPPLDTVTPFDLDARDRKRDSYRGPLLDGGPILRTGRQRSCGDEYCG